MSKAPSDKTLLQTERRLTRDLRVELERYKQFCAEYRMRASKAEADAAEWKNRFDVLLSKGFEANRGAAK